MSLKLFGCVCGHLDSAGAAMGVAAPRVKAPMPFYVIDHPKGLTLFDCGLHEGMLAADDVYRGRLASQDMHVVMGPDETPAARMQALDFDPAAVTHIVLSHLHFDHAGGLHRFPNATVVVQRREWEAGFDEQLAARYGLPRAYFDLGHPVTLIDGEHDLFGDGALTLVPSYGHTPGHQSLRVRSEAGEHLLVGDACYFCDVVRTRSFPSFADKAAMNASLDALLALQGPDTVMVFGHDPDQWGDTPVLPVSR
ncbi:N-acyl homoserine lactonase family protein [Caulobacter sp. KR2-114]|uniref:N-acyl homoserine lactonase family protein n=1 Tax=Caulobacter sp. KR2-114 TaxID=3400912 RepID=UPI003C09DB78